MTNAFLIAAAVVAVIVFLAGASVAGLSWLLTHGAGFITRHISAEDPDPEYSRLDQLDGHPRTTCIINQEAFTAMARRHAGDTK